MRVWEHGKSVDLLKVAFNYEERGYKVMLLTAEIDDRYETGKITTRMGLDKSAHTFNDNTNIYDLCKLLNYVPACVLVDEAQFLTKKHVDELSDIVDYLDIPVICYGLRSDFRNELFEGSKALLSKVDKIEELKTICECGKKATCNMRILNGKITTSGNQILIGDLEYKSACRKCYKERVKNDGEK